MHLGRILNTQYKQCNKTIDRIFFEEILHLLPRIKEHERCKREMIAILFGTIIDTAPEAVSAFIRQRKSKDCIKLYLV